VALGRGPDQEAQVVTGIELLPDMERAGFDYVELSLSDLMRLDEKEFAALRRTLDRSAVKCEACHNFLPSAIRLTGPDADLSAAVEYAESALRRAAEIGTRIVVFGSAGARHVPPGFPRESAKNQIVRFLRMIGPVAGECDIVIAVEALNRRESNIVTTLSEALDLSREVDDPRIMLVADCYHMAIEHESAAVILEAGTRIRHAHVADPEHRGFPVIAREQYGVYLAALEDTRSCERLSIEAFTSNFEEDAAASIALLRSLPGK